MSIQFNPKAQQTAVAPEQPKPPKPGFLQWWADCLYKGSKMESMPCAKYCQWQWDIRDPDTFGLKRKVFFEKCMSDCALAKFIAEGSRKL